jgi:hypothetical protein
LALIRKTQAQGVLVLFVLSGTASKRGNLTCSLEVAIVDTKSYDLEFKKARPPARPNAIQLSVVA